MKENKPVAAYIAAAPFNVRTKLQALDKIIKTCAPGAEEAVSYGLPAYRYYGNLIGFAVHKEHIGLYVFSGTFLEKYGKELQGYDTSKGALRLPLDKPLPITLIRKLVKGRVRENEAKKKSAGYGKK